VESTAHDSSGQRSGWERLCLASGILAAIAHLAFLAIFIGLVAPSMPPLDAPAAQAAAFYAEQSRSPIYLLVSYLFQAQLLFLLPFFGGLYSVLRRAERQGGALAATVFASGVALALIPPMAEMIEHHLLLGLAAAGADPVVVRGFDGMAPVSFALAAFPQALILGGSAALLLSQALAPRWLGWSGLGLAALSLVATGTLIAPAMVFVGMGVALLFKLWIMALSVALIRQRRGLPAAQPRPIAYNDGRIA
jgi:hypothetical protein